jgi:hypothetical protein
MMYREKGAKEKYLAMGGGGVAGEDCVWRELDNSHGSLHIIAVVKSKMRWVGHVARMGRLEIPIKFSCKNLKGRGCSEYLHVHRRIILKWVLRI